MQENKIKYKIEDILQERITVFPSYSGQLQTESGKLYFLKTGHASTTFACEAHGLNELIRPRAINIAKPVAYSDTFILTEFIEQGRPSNTFFEDFGRQFAQLHHHKGSEFGLFEDNFIGANEQLNLAEGHEKTNWTTFYFNKRLLFQYKLAEKNHLVSESLKHCFSKLEHKIESIIGEPQEEAPTLLHGDLWSGNFICNTHGEAVLIDPAVYYGHREVDLAMTKLFGGFSPSFYHAYQQEYPLQEGWEYREDIYKLYHVLNHLNIFGRGYLSEAEWIAEKYCH